MVKSHPPTKEGARVSEPVCSFSASLPDISSAMNISGAGNGVRLKLDVPESEIGQVFKLVLMRGKVFRVTVEEAEE